MVLAEIPVRLCCGQRHWTAICPDGRFMCCLCFDRFPAEDAYEDEEGRWDICQPCGERDRIGGAIRLMTEMWWGSWKGMRSRF